MVVPMTGQDSTRLVMWYALMFQRGDQLWRGILREMSTRAVSRHGRICLMIRVGSPASKAIHWPGDARVAFYVGLNVEHFYVDRPSTSLIEATASLVPDALNYGWRDYGPRVGIWRVIDSLDGHGIRASVLLNSAAANGTATIRGAGARTPGWLSPGKSRLNMPGWVRSGSRRLETIRAPGKDVMVMVGRHRRRKTARWLRLRLRAAGALLLAVSAGHPPGPVPDRVRVDPHDWLAVPAAGHRGIRP